ncbi:MAG: hypothetical protein JRE57_00205 [Deltaproteobacteria bacterium]|nr:hypothetical protein [Deltaproteobacteria bacterium]
MTISAAVLDFYDDSSHELMSKVAMPDSLGDTHVTVLTPEQIEQMPDTDFGLVVLTKRASVLRKFPVCDPGNAWLSAQYFQQTHEKLAFPARFVAAKFIKSACDAYGVPTSPLVDGYAARASDDVQHNTFTEGSEQRWMLQKLAKRELMTKQADAVEINALIDMPNEHFALVARDGDGTVIRKYAMPDAGHVKLAANYFDKYAMDLAPEHRHRFATSVTNRATELGVDVSDNMLLSKWASSTWNRHVVAHIEQRKSLLPRNEGACAVLNKLAAALEETDPEDMASALQTFDQATGLTRYYDRGLTDPFASSMSKKADGWSADIDGRTITDEDLRKPATIKKIAGYLGESFARQFSEHPSEVFESLPTPEKVLIKQVISGEA